MQDQLRKISLVAKRHIYTVCAFAVCIGFLFTSYAPIAHFVNEQLAMPLLFKARAKISQPSLDPRLKVFAYDDKTAAVMQRFDLSLPSWAKLIRGIAENKPSVIMFDKLFDSHFKESEAAEFNNILDNIETPIVTIGFGGREDIPGRTPISQDLVVKPHLTQANTLPAEEYAHFYAADPTVRENFQIGHAHYERNGFLRPLLKLDDQKYVGHWFLATIDKWSVIGNRISIGDELLPLTYDGFLIPSYAPQAFYRERVKTLLPTLAKTITGRPLTEIKEGDYVIILPAMYTGNTDWHQTPFGTMPGGYIMASLVNSAISHNWVRPISIENLLILLGLAIPFLITRLAPSRWYLSICFGIAILFVTTTFIIFVAQSLLLSWLLPLTHFVAQSALGYGRLAYRLELDRVRWSTEVRAAQLFQESYIGDEPEHSCIAIHFDSASECGGDHWFWKELQLYDNKPPMLVGGICDATGHGLSAALISSMASSAIQLALADKSQERTRIGANIIDAVNDALFHSKSELATAVMGVFWLDPTDNKLRVINSGTQFPILIRNPNNPTEKPVKTVSGGGSVLGMEEQALYYEREVQMNPGDKLVMFSDGLVENSPPHKPAISTKNLKKMLGEQPFGEPMNLRNALVTEYENHLSGHSGEDDVTILVLECPKNAEPRDKQAPKPDRAS